ncbi:MULTISPECIES: PstS family phosphate ABC transporter substrate-binding protein [Bacillaceae]|uniref:Phosphate-binding protein n=1 Tax=Oceanobacillus caeni TaxID=405946 RepID=A0ABR5MKS0_9BACI|nr:MULTISPECIES: PstS family phosphate ABC transporter substrate-binding protein [Bacillaceae]KPH76462.1 phosphate ABC transporter phosphate-binding protein [Oceanobacillus caeni]MED4475863.1 PstS family phosphate ABC transporter substrate-binding protein [Oceanobacillus caeni]
MKFKKYLMFLVVVGLVLFLAACGGAEEESNTEGTESEENTSGEEGAFSELEGNIAIDGSGTVYPLMSRLAEEYMVNEQPNVSVEVSRAGTSAGFKKFLAEGGTDFNNASREIKEEEQAKADELGIEVMELKVALDGLTIVVNPENDFATELTEDQVKDIFLGNVTKWSEINPDWPDEEIQTYGPNENHGTYEFFYENILEEQDLVGTTNLQQDYSTLVTLVAEDVNAIGFFGFGYYDSNQDKVKAVGIDFGEGAVVPSLDTIGEEGPYANYTRPVFTYLNVNNAKEKPQVFDYATYILESMNDFAGKTGFAPIPEEEVQAQLEELQAIN